MSIRSLTGSCCAVLAMVLLNACGGGGGGDGGGDFSDIPVTTTDFVFSLSPEQVIAGPSAPETAYGSASFQTRARGTVEILASGSVNLTGFEATSVNVHEGFAGETGPLLIELQQTTPTTWAFPAGTELDDDELRRLEQSGFYVLASGAGGHLRGQVLSEGWSVSMFDLSGDEVVPAVTTPATGRGAISVRPQPGFRHDYHVRVTTSGLDDAIGGVMAEAFAGGNGGPIATLEQSNSSPGVWGTADINDVNFAPSFLDAGLATFLSGGLYVALQTAANPDGEVRGQLIPEGVTILPITLSENEVVPGPVTSEGSASAIATYRLSTGEIAVNLLTDIPNPSAVSLHQAPFGENGPLLYSFFQDFSVPGLWSLAATMLSAEQQTALADQALYLTVLTPAYPEGELRGQLSAEASPAAGQPVIDGDAPGAL